MLIDDFPTFRPASLNDRPLAGTGYVEPEFLSLGKDSIGGTLAKRESKPTFPVMIRLDLATSGKECSSEARKVEKCLLCIIPRVPIPYMKFMKPFP